MSVAELDQAIRILAEMMLGEDATPVRVGRDPKYKGHRRDLLEALRMHDHRVLIEDVEFLVGSHEHPDRIAKRVGYVTRDALVRQMVRIGRKDLASFLDRVDHSSAA